MRLLDSSSSLVVLDVELNFSVTFKRMWSILLPFQKQRLILEVFWAGDSIALLKKWNKKLRPLWNSSFMLIIAAVQKLASAFWCCFIGLLNHPRLLQWSSLAIHLCWFCCSILPSTRWSNHHTNFVSFPSLPYEYKSDGTFLLMTFWRRIGSKRGTSSTIVRISTLYGLKITWSPW